MLQKKVLQEAKLRATVHEFLKLQLKEAGYSGMRLVRTPIGTQVSVFVHRPGLVIGTGGKNIRDLSKILEEKFGLSDPQVAIVEIEVPELEPEIMAAKIADALEKGVRYRRAATWALSRIMAAGAIGAQIVIRGKLTSERSRFEKFSGGYVPSSGDPAMKQVKTAVLSVLLKQGLIGIKVKILPPGATFPDEVKIKEAKPPEEKAIEVVESEKGEGEKEEEPEDLEGGD
ncbi:MAG: 30S ribosomal protein S3 [Thermoproteota archaeon]